MKKYMEFSLDCQRKTGRRIALTLKTGPHILHPAQKEVLINKLASDIKIISNCDKTIF